MSEGSGSDVPEVAVAPSRSFGTACNVALLYALVCLGLFAPAFFGGRCFFPIHTDLMRPWSEGRSADQLASARRAANEALTDQNFLFHPDTALIVERMRAGELPLWNPTILGGVSFPGQALYGMFYPPNLVLLLVRPLTLAYSVDIALHVWLAAFGAFLLLRALGCSGLAAFLGGLMFAVSGPLVVRYHYYMTFFPAVWVPYLFLVVHRFCAEPRLTKLWSVPVLVALILLSGFPQTGLYGVYFAMAYGAGRLLRERRRAAWRPVLLLAGSCVLAGGFAAIQLLPVRETFQYSTPRIHRLSDQIKNGGSPWMPLSYVIPDAFRDTREPWSVDLARNLLWSGLYCRTTPAAPGLGFSAQPLNHASPNPTETSCYAGSITLISALCGLLAGRGRMRLWLLLALAVGWSYCLGFGPVVAFGHHLLPGLQFGDVRRILPTLALFTAMLATLGFDQLASLRRARMKLVLAVVALFLGALLAWFLVLRFSGPEAVYSWLERRVQARYEYSPDIATELEKALGADDQDSIFQFLYRKALGALGWFVMGAVAWWSSMHLARTGQRAYAALVFAFCLLIDLGSYHFRYNPFVPQARFLEHLPFLEEIARVDGRVHRYQPTRAPNPLQMVLTPNLGAHFRIEDAMGYIVTVPLRYARYMEAIEPAHESVVEVGVFPLQDPGAAALESPLLDAASIAQILTRSANAPNLALGARAEGRYRLNAQHGDSQAWVNLKALPRAQVFARATVVPTLELKTKDDSDARVHDQILERLRDSGNAVRERLFLEGAADPPGFTADPRSEAPVIPGERSIRLEGKPAFVRMLDRRPERVVIDLEPGDGGILYLTDNYEPGWEAEVDGVATSIHPANVAFRGVVLPAGARQVVMTYRPKGFQLGRWISLGSVLAWGGMIVAFRRRRR